MFKRLLYLFLLPSLVLPSCTEEEKLFTTLDPDKTKVYFSNRLTNSEGLNILNYLYFYNGSGVSIGDFNNDGYADIYFTANQSEDKLYLNLGDFVFKDITEASGINNSENWTTGSTTVDINGDGLLDIYICKVGDFNSINGHNLLYINQGTQDGVPSFKESSVEYGLNFKTFATQSIFFDYDLDEDLDLFLLNHSVHPNRNYGKGSLRTRIDTLSGDRLYENVNGTFKDVTKESGIFQGKIGYGLGLSVSDINNDGYPDIYIGNDFFENDYLYINQKNGTFKEIISLEGEKLGHTSHFSMGNAIEDINNDGLSDIISLDMLPEDLQTYKASAIEYSYPIYQNYLKNGYAPQFMQNTLHINNGNETFSETAYISNIAATEWSWSPITADFDNDGFKDIYVTNGIVGATNNMDFINFISNEAIQKKLGKDMNEEDLDLIKKIPEKKVSNYIFKNNKNKTFTNVTDKWWKIEKSFSNGGAYADLDNDGDLDLIINNINGLAYILKNNSEKLYPENESITVNFKGSKRNPFGIGSKVVVYSESHEIVSENFTTKGYLSSVEPNLTIGIGKLEKIDSLKIIWPGGKFQTLSNINPKNKVIAKYDEARKDYYALYSHKKNNLLTNSKPLIEFEHKDEISIEFSRDPLIPFSTTNTGPEISIVDINNDQLDDLFIGGAKYQASKMYLQTYDGSFIAVQDSLFQASSINEDVSQTFFDADNDGFDDLLIVSGGNEFRVGKPLKPRFYTNENGKFQIDTLQFNKIEINASKVKSVDFDNDGDLDISIISNVVPWKFGETPRQYFFENDGKGNFLDISDSIGDDFVNAGNVEDIVWIDLNNDEFKDVILVGKWMPIKIFMNDGKRLRLQNFDLEGTNGWWNCVKAEDFDNDGDIDIIVGNWGKNTRLNASINEPITLYSNDFDGNGKVDPLITYFYNGIITPLASKDELAKQLPFLNKEFLSYDSFAKASISDLFPSELLKKAEKKYVYTLASSYLENLGDNSFEIVELPFNAQLTSINDILIDDFNHDGFFDIFLVGNDYEVSTQLGRLDASHGTLLLNDKKGFFIDAKYYNFDISGPARSMKKIQIKDTAYYIVAINNKAPIFLKKSLNNNSDEKN